jgi:hypothetical protein
MTHADWFQTLAEIGLGFAGFSALIAGMRRGEQNADPENASRGRAVVETSLSVLFACALPALLIGLGLTQTTAFRVAGGLFLLAGAPLSIRGFRRAIKTRSTKRVDLPALTVLGIIGGSAGLFFFTRMRDRAPAGDAPDLLFRRPAWNTRYRGHQLCGFRFFDR